MGCDVLGDVAAGELKRLMTPRPIGPRLSADPSGSVGTKGLENAGVAKTESAGWVRFDSGSESSSE